MSDLSFEFVVECVYEDCDPQCDRDDDVSVADLRVAFAGFSAEQQEELDDLARKESRWMDEKYFGFLHLYDEKTGLYSVRPV